MLQIQIHPPKEARWLFKQKEVYHAIHGVVIDLSPIKCSKNNPTLKCYNGKISDEVKCARVISFDPKSRPALETSQVEGKPIALVNCKVRPGKYDPSLEITVSNNTEVELLTKNLSRI